MDHWTPWNPFGHPDPEYAGHAYFHPSLEGVHDAHRLPRAPTRCAIERYYSLTFRPSKEGGDVIFREEGLERENYQYPETASVPCLYVARRRIEPEPFGPPFRSENEAPRSRRARGLPRGVPLSLCRRRGARAGDSAHARVQPRVRARLGRRLGPARRPKKGMRPLPPLVLQAGYVHEVDTRDEHVARADRLPEVDDGALALVLSCAAASQSTRTS